MACGNCNVEKLIQETVWYCCQCGNGPMGIWYIGCPVCGHSGRGPFVRKATNVMGPPADQSFRNTTASEASVISSLHHTPIDEALPQSTQSPLSEDSPQLSGQEETGSGLYLYTDDIVYGNNSADERESVSLLEGSTAAGAFAGVATGQGRASPFDELDHGHPQNLPTATRATGIAEDEDDCQSIQSAESSTTLISTLSGYTAVEMEGATVELERLFQEDSDLTELYQMAIEDASIGPERLQRNLVRLLRRMARDLRTEANKEVEKLASRFVAMKARYVAHCIVEEAHNQPVAVQLQQKDKKQEESEDEADVGEQPEGDDLEQVQPIDEDRFEDLETFRAFLLHSNAFQVFRSQLTAFVLPKEPQTNKIGSLLKVTEIKAPQMSSYIALNWICRFLNASMNVIGLVEPQPKHNTTRLRWQCRCGDSFLCDVQEYSPGGIDRFRQRLQRSGCENVTISTYDEGVNGKSYTFRPPAWLRSASRSMTSILTRTSNDTTCLPQHHASSVTRSAVASTPVPATPQRDLYLMACMHRTQHHINVVQDLLEEVTTDRQLFNFLRKQLRQHRNRVGNMLTLKRVQRIFFVKFRLRKGSVAEVRHHKTCCTQQTCECIPPQLKVIRPPMGSGEYDCNPSGPPDTWPPVCPEFMMHMLYSPDCIVEDDSSILDQLPKKIDCKLAEINGPPPEGWGLYYQEEVDISIIIGVIFLVLFLTSLVFVVLWTVLRDDIQGASGVGAYIVAIASMVGIWVATKSKSFG